jgi:hypothetical protein
LITGGTVNPRILKDRRKDEYRRRTGRMPERRGLISAVKRKLKPGALYLMIVNLPTEEELNLARAMLDAEKASK